MAEKFIEVKRFYGLIEEAQSDPDTTAWLGESYKGIGPYFVNKAIATGLTPDEQKILLPVQYGIESTDKEFRKVVEEKYNEFVTAVPKNGVKLNISLPDNTAPVSAENFPIVLKDYLAYRHIIGSSDVASDLNEAKRNPLKKFYIVDPEKASGEAININKLEDDALSLYFKHKDDIIKVDMILTLMNVANVYSMKKEDKQIKFKSFAMKQQNLNEYQQKEAYIRFKDVCVDKDLEMKYLIRSLIGAQVLERIGEAVLLKETGEKLGDSLREAVLFLNNTKNTRISNKLRAEYNVKVRQGVFNTDEAKTPDPSVKQAQ